MIHKIETITSIGKFRSYKAVGNVSMNKLTVVYADNGSGKTTLSAILRSLTENNTAIIKRRLSTRATLPQAVQIVQRNGGGDTHYTFHHTNGWKLSLAGIEIFDTHFVNENIYSGFDFSDDHKKQLHRFVIGAQGVAVQQQIEENKALKTETRARIEKLEQKIVELVGSGLTLDRVSRFINIPITDTEGIDEKITKAQTVLTTSQASAEISRLDLLVSMPNISPGISFDKIAIDLKSTADTIQDELLLGIYRNHCTDLSSHSIDASEKWLQLGYSYLQSKQLVANDIGCPFCKQPIRFESDIIKSYTAQFNEAFKALLGRLSLHLKTLRDFNLDTALQGMDHVNQFNSGLSANWARYYTGSVPAPTYDCISDAEILRTEYAAAIASVEQKIQNPTLPIESTAIEKFIKSFDEVTRRTERYNREKELYNSALSELKRQIQPVSQMQEALNRLLCIKRRRDTDVDILCLDWQKEREALKKLEEAYPLLVVQQEMAATTFFTSYQGKINYYLKTIFKTPFQIVNVEHVAPQGRGVQSKINYKLTIDGQDISFDHSQTNNIKDCLSEGDKSTIALAFFLAKLDIDPNKADKILVFDDPLSSLDSNRRLYTVHLIKDLLPQLKQVLVFSHNEHFLSLVYKDVAASDKKALRIEEDLKTNSSTISELDLDKLVQNDYYKYIDELDAFLSNADINRRDHILGLIRNALEAHIRFKFYRQTNGIPPNKRTFGTLVDTLEGSGVFLRDNADRVNIFSKLRMLNAISSKPHHGEGIPDFGLLGMSNPEAMTAKELGDLVKDALELIDDKL